MKKQSACIRAYLGGSFDPVHNGHLAMAQTVNLALHQAYQQGIINDYHVSMLPTAGNPFKTGQSAIHHRLAMLKLALQSAHQDNQTSKPIGLDLTEINTTQANTPSYTIDTLTTLKNQHPHDVLILIIGFDSLQALPTWKSGLQILKLANLWVFLRPTNDTDKSNHQIPQVLHPYQHHEQTALFKQNYGIIYQDKTPILTISSTAIRNAINLHATTNLPISSAVQDYIIQHKLYATPKA